MSGRYGTPGRGVRWARIALGVLALGLTAVSLSMFFGAYLRPHLVQIFFWTVGAAVVHDGLAAPTEYGTGWLVGRVLPGPYRVAVRLALVVAGALTIVAVPAVLRRGVRPNPTLLAMPYLQNWLLLLGVVAAVTAVTVLVQRTRARRRA